MNSQNNAVIFIMKICATKNSFLKKWKRGWRGEKQLILLLYLRLNSSKQKHIKIKEKIKSNSTSASQKICFKFKQLMRDLSFCCRSYYFINKSRFVHSLFHSFIPFSFKLLLLKYFFVSLIFNFLPTSILKYFCSFLCIF